MADTTVVGGATKSEALAKFFDVLDAHAERIERTKKKVDDIYAFRTPSTPYFEYTVTDMSAKAVTPFSYEPGTWVENVYDKKLDGAIQRIVYNLEMFQNNDYVPSVHPQLVA